jgi:hypothetical protein
MPNEANQGQQSGGQQKVNPSGQQQSGQKKPNLLPNLTRYFLNRLIGSRVDCSVWETERLAPSYQIPTRGGKLHWVTYLGL